MIFFEKVTRMNSRAVLASGIGLAAATLACAVMAPQADERDYSILPSKPSETEQRLIAFPMSLTQAIDMAQEEVGGYAMSAEIHMDRMPASVEVLAYAQGKAKLVVIDAEAQMIEEVRDVPRFPGWAVDGDWIETESGLMYYELKLGEGLQPPDRAALLKMEYTAYFVDGRKLDSSADRGTPLETMANSLPDGWAEGMLGMNAGGKRKLIVPASLAFGEEGNPPVIPPNATIIIDVELIQVIDYSKVPDELPGEPVEGEPVTTETGLMYYDLVVGEGEMPMDSTVTVMVHYTGYLNDGTKFDSSIDRGEPTKFPLNRVIQGWTEGVSSMKVGGKRKLVVPFGLGYGESGAGQSIPPRATLIFDIELIEIVKPEAPKPPEMNETGGEAGSEHDNETEHDK